VKEVAPPVLAPKPEKLPNFWGTPGCWWYCFKVSELEVRKGFGHTVVPGGLTSATAGLFRLGRPRILRAVRELEYKEALGPAMKGRTPALPDLTPWLLVNLFGLPVEIIH